MYMIKISHSESNNILLYSEYIFEYSIFKKDVEKEKFKLDGEAIEERSIEFFESNNPSKGSGKSETILILYKNNESERILQSEDEENDEFFDSIRIYYGEDPECDLCERKGKGFIIAGIILSLICLLFMSICLCIVIKFLCKKSAESFDLEKNSDNSASIKNVEDFQSNPYEDNQTLELNKTGDTKEEYIPKKNPNLIMKKETIPGEKPIEVLYNTE